MTTIIEGTRPGETRLVEIDGILGERTREAVQTEQSRLGLPADAWPTRALLDRL